MEAKDFFFTVLTLIVILLALSKNSANAQTLSWEPPTEREDGTLIEKDLVYEVTRDGELFYTGPETSLGIDLKLGDNCYAITSKEGADGARSQPRLACFTVIPSPPLPPVFKELK